MTGRRVRAPALHKRHAPGYSRPRPGDLAVGPGAGRGAGTAARSHQLYLVAGLQPRRHDPGVRLRRLHRPPLGHLAAEEAQRRAARGRSPQARGGTPGRAVVAAEEGRGRGRGSPAGGWGAERGAASGGVACRAAAGAAASGRPGQPARSALTPQPLTRLRAPVRHTELSLCRGVRRGGCIGQCNQRRRVGPQRAGHYGLGARVDPTGALHAE